MKSKSLKKVSLSDANLLLTITIVVFFLMYIGAMIFEGGGFLKPQTFFNILNANGALIITACGLSLVMITGSIDISVSVLATPSNMLTSTRPTGNSILPDSDGFQNDWRVLL